MIVGGWAVESACRPTWAIVLLKGLLEYRTRTFTRKTFSIVMEDLSHVSLRKVMLAKVLTNVEIYAAYVSGTW